MRDQPLEHDAEDVGALVVVELSDAEDDGGRAAADGGKPALHVEGRAFAPGRERWRGEEGVQRRSERRVVASGGWLGWRAGPSCHRDSHGGVG